jgi:hypothetical protein
MAMPSPLSPEPIYSVPSSVPSIPNISNQFPDAYPAAPQVYSDISPTPYATDTPALIPTVQQPVISEPSFFNWEAPLQTEGFNFPDSQPLPTLPTMQLIDPVTPPLSDKFGFYPEQPVVYSESYDIPTAQPSSGPLEFIGDVVKTGLDAVWDAGKFILEHLDVGIGYAGDIGGQAASKRYYEDLGSAQQTAAEAAKIKAQAYAAQVAAGTMTAEEAIARGVGLGIDTLAGIPSAPSTSQPVFLTTPTAQAGGPNYMLYAAIGLAAYYLLR